MQEVTREILKVFEDLERMQIKQKQNGVGEAARDAYGYAFEPYDAFSTKPLEFIETALRLDIEAREMFAMLRTLNRHSPLFYKLSGEFEKILKLLGSCCITKAVLEKQENESFELLQDLTIDRLREMTAFNFRKCSAAFMDSRACGKTNLDAFSLSVRWSALDKRLIATGEKIGRIRRQELPAAGTQLPEPMGTVSDGCEVSRKGLSPMAKYPVDSFQELPVTGCRLPVDSSQYPMALAEKGRAFRVIGSQESGSGSQGLADSGTQLPETMETVPAGTNACQRGLSPLDQQPVSPSGTGPVGTSGRQQVQSPMAQFPKLPVTGCRLTVDSSQSPMAQYPAVSPQELAVTGCSLPVDSSQPPMALAFADSSFRIPNSAFVHAPPSW